MPKNAIKPSAWASALMVASLAACAGTGAEYRPIVDGPVASGFETDLAACQDLSREREIWNADTKSDALAGGLLGAAVGAAGDALAGGIVVGAAGALLGAGGQAYEILEERKQIVISCMAGRGYQVIG